MVPVTRAVTVYSNLEMMQRKRPQPVLRHLHGRTERKHKTLYRIFDALYTIRTEHPNTSQGHCRLTLSCRTTYMSYRTANLQMLHFIYYSTNIRTEYFKHAAHSPFFFSSKCHLFHNATFFGSCVIHILYTECAKIKKKSGAKRLILYCEKGSCSTSHIITSINSMS